MSKVSDEAAVDEAAVRAANVWDDGGSLLRHVEWPAEISLAPPRWVGADWALGVRRDSLGVEHVVRLRF